MYTPLTQHNLDKMEEALPSDDGLLDDLDDEDALEFEAPGLPTPDPESELPLNRHYSLQELISDERLPDDNSPEEEKTDPETIQPSIN